MSGKATYGNKCEKCGEFFYSDEPEIHVCLKCAGKSFFKKDKKTEEEA